MKKDFTGQNLRNRSFRGQQLAGASFHAADLRGADFSGADLHGADLSGARAGMARAWAAVVALFALIASLLLGVVAGLGGRWLGGMIQHGDPRHRAIGFLLTVELAIFLVVFAWKGLDVALRRVIPGAIGVAVVAAAIAVITGIGPGTGLLSALAFSALLVAVVGLGTLARASAGSVNMVLFMIVALSGGLIGGATGGGPYALAIALSCMLAGRRALGGGVYPRITDLVTDFACAGGTRFRDADLSGVSFAAAELRNSDFRGARLENTHFEAAHLRLCAFDRGAREGR